MNETVFASVYNNELVTSDGRVVVGTQEEISAFTLGTPVAVPREISPSVKYEDCWLDLQSA